MSATSLSDWLREHPPPEAAYTQSLAAVAGRVLAGEDFFLAVRELLDEVAVTLHPAQITRAISAEPPPTGDVRQDAYLAALAEHLGTKHGLPVPAWSCAPSRFLDEFWFPSEIKGFRAIAIASSPAAFRRRGVFISAGSLQRV